MEAEAYSERTTDASYARLESVCTVVARCWARGRAAGKWSSRLADDGRLRLLVEQWSLQIVSGFCGC